MILVAVSNQGNKYVHSTSTKNSCFQCTYPYVQLELLVKFAAYVPELFMCQIEAVYIYNVNMAFRQYAFKLSSAVRIFSHIKVSGMCLGPTPGLFFCILIFRYQLIILKQLP